jgi:hypothetical protein
MILDMPDFSAWGGRLHAGGDTSKQAAVAVAAAFPSVRTDSTHCLTKVTTQQ